MLVVKKRREFCGIRVCYMRLRVLISSALKEVKIKEVFLSRTRAGTEMRIKFQLITNDDGKHSQAHKRCRR